jgi:acyl carrier protein
MELYYVPYNIAHPGHAMSMSTETIAAAIITAVGSTAGSVPPSAQAQRSEMLQGVDSLGLMMVFADVQDALGVEFEPEHLMQLFLCPTIEAMAMVIAGIRATDS